METVKPGIYWEERRGYHLSETMNKAIPALFRRSDRFYHWHTDSAIIGYFLLSDSLEAKIASLFVLLITQEPSCLAFGLSKEVWEALSGENFNNYSLERA